MSKVHVAYTAADRAIVERLVELLTQNGIEVSYVPFVGLRAGTDYDAWVQAAIRDSSKVLVLWSAASVKSASVLREAEAAIAEGKLFPVTLGVAVPAEFSRIAAFDLRNWSGQASDPRFQDLVRACKRDGPAGAAPTPQRDDGPTPRMDPFESTLGGPAPSPAQRPPIAPSASRPPVAIPNPYQRRTVEPPQAAPPPVSRTSGGLLSRAVDRVRGMFAGRKSAPASPSGNASIAVSLPQSAPAASAVEPVLLGATAPRQCTRGQRFTAALVAYIEAARESAKEKLAALGEPGDRVVMDVAPQRNASWSIGAPVAVRLAGEGVDLTPAEVSFEWNGRENLAAFAIRVSDDAPETISLAFEVFVAGLPVAFIPMNVNVASRPAPLIAQEAQATLPHTVFASYSSKDAQPVTQRLSTLLRWSPGLDIFQDCLDLQPNKAFQPQIKAEISRRDVFLLFWSRNAAASQWVQWEYETARDTRGPDAILPMPLEDPAIAPPPADLADRHFRDRFMLAGYGLAKIRDEAARPPP